MGKVILFLSTVLVLNSQLFPQLKDGAVELSLSGTLGSYSISYDNPYYSSAGDSKTYFLLALRTGFFVTGNLEIEPEINLFIQDETGVNIGANLSYNFFIPESNVHPFIMAGLGIGNSVMVFTLPAKSSEDFNVVHYNIGAGIKVMMTESIAARIEYRYRKFNSDGDYADLTYNTHNLLFGFSVFL